MTLVYISQGLELNTGLTVGVENPMSARFTVDGTGGNVVTVRTIECYNGITTYGDIACNALVAPSIYSKTEIGDLLTLKATISYVDGQLVLNANQAITYTTNRDRQYGNTKGHDSIC